MLHAFRHTSTLIASAALALAVVSLPVQIAPAPRGRPSTQFLSTEPARTGGRGEGGPHCVDGVRGGQAQRLHRRRVRRSSRPPHELLERRRRRHLDDPDFGRRVDVVFLRGTAPNRDGWVANPSADPAAPSEQSGRPAPPAGRRGSGGRRRAGARSRRQLRLFVKDGQIYRALVPAGARERKSIAARSRSSRNGAAERTTVVARRKEGSLRHDPHRSQLRRGLRHVDAHGHIHVAKRRLRHESDVDRRWQEHRLLASPWSRIRTAGAAGQRGIGIPNGPAFQTGPGARGAGWSRGQRRRDAGGTAGVDAGPSRGSRSAWLEARHIQRRLHVSVMKADVAPGEAQEVWHNQPNDRSCEQHRECAPGRRISGVPESSAAGGRGGRGEVRRRVISLPRRAGRRVGSLLLAEFHQRRRRVRSC